MPPTVDYEDSDKPKTSTLKENAKAKLDRVKKLVKTAMTLGGIKTNFDDIPQSALGRIELYTYNLEMSELFQSI